MTQRRIYQNEFPYFVTFRTREGYLLFDQTKYAELLSKVIFKTSLIKGYDVLSYQIMPDHLHLLTYNQIQAHPAVGALHSKMGSAGRDARVRGIVKRHSSINPSRVSVPAMSPKTVPAMSDKQYNISDLMYAIKSYFYNELRKHHDIPYSIWHPRFYTRIIDNHKYLKNTIHYIKHNLVKAELSKKYHHPHTNILVGKK